MGKGRMVIAGSVNNDFEPLKKLTDRSLDRDELTGGEVDVGGPLAVGGSERYILLMILAEPLGVS